MRPYTALQILPRAMRPWQYATRLQSTTRARFHIDPVTSPSPSPQPKKNNKNSGLAVAVALALGSSVVSLLYHKDEPLEMTEVQPLFNKNDVHVVFVLGGPGAGKGTQCARLVKDHGYVHLSAGDLLRQEQERPGSKVGALIKEYIKEGQIVPQEVTIGLLADAISHAHDNGSSNFLVDGFPRKMDQALTFEREVVPCQGVLFLDCPEEVMRERLMERGKTSGRADDNAEAIAKRFRTFVETSMPVVEYYGEKGMVKRVVCDKPVDEVYESVEGAMKQW